MTNNLFMAKFFLFVLFFFLVGPNIKIFGVEPQHWLFLVFFILLFAQGFINGKNNKDKIPLLLIFPSILVLFSFLSKILVHNITFADFTQMLKYLTLYFYAFSVFQLTKHYSRIEVLNYIQRILGTVSIAIIYISIIGILQFFIPSLIEGAFKIFYETENIGLYQGVTNLTSVETLSRVTSVYNTPMVFGGAIALLTFSLIIFRKGKYSWVDITAIILGTIALFLTNTRSPIFGFIIGILIFFIKDFKKIIIPSIFILFLVLIVLSQNEASFYDNSIRFEEIIIYVINGFDLAYIPANLASRIIDINYVWTVFSSSDFMFTGVVKSFYQSAFTFNSISLHNQFFSWFIQFGIFGLILIIWPFYTIFDFSKIYKNSNDQAIKMLFNGLVIIIIVALIVSISQPVMLSMRWREFLFIFIALAYSYKYKVE